MSVYLKCAEAVLFGTVKEYSEIVERFGLVYRKDKGIQDINRSLLKAKRTGNMKIENEIGMFELYLKDVLKPQKK